MFPWLEDSFKQLGSRIAANKLHHALLIQGPAGLGKSSFVLQLAQLLLCKARQGHKVCGQCQSCLLNAATTHPDLHVVESDKQIGVDQIRDVIKKLVSSAHLSGAKVLIIYDAHTMTESSANALLKTLEEPTANTFLLLTTDKPERILATIKSRCEKLALPLPPLDATLAWVKTQFDGEIDINFAKLFSARPLALLAELQEEQKFTYDIFSRGLEALLQGQTNAMQLAMDWQDSADKVLKWTQYWARQQCTDDAPETVWQLHQQATKVTQQLRNPGVNKTLVLTELLDKLALVKVALT
ncbi:DNA polymerase III subunit delta' [Paraglaciecola sp. MB-3u-78]|uniref:DNA polymerase III subunit delta' n=1 Tax=Paraglaciecola sp. MB-3u-78 TaxID=2058332 RepID=UPI000C34020C|nr:DNA polymerase III subunit delta' [Paraglaciecola sp. MB-3u-78]PKG99452.1 DNA polymerase III subunit delta' [Paraglaciecola sp. MB-3u-78]